VEQEEVGGTAMKMLVMSGLLDVCLQTGLG
jgi:hypothetical protein